MNAEGSAGLVVVDKPAGMTSHDVVSRIRRLAGTRKVGHAGTLDPMATGVLLAGVNRATRLLGHLMLTTKTYDAVVRLGETTTTDDAEGETLAVIPAARLGDAEIRAAFARLVGDIEQVPAAVSAIKVEGRRAYARVRAGEQVELPARPVTIHRIDVGGIRRADDRVDVEISVSCSSGTYIRAIARDVGSDLDVGGHLTSLRRTAVGPFALSDAHTLDALAHDFTMVGIDDVARRCFPAHVVDEAGAADIAVGRRLPVALAEPGPVAMFDGSGRFLALYEQRGDVAAPVAVFV